MPCRSNDFQSGELASASTLACSQATSHNASPVSSTSTFLRQSSHHSSAPKSMDQPAPASPGSALQRAPEISQDQPIITGLNSSAPVSTQQRPLRKQNKNKQATPCKFFATKHGCRAGDTCPFLHDQEAAVVATSTARSRADSPSTSLALANAGSDATSAKVGDDAREEVPNIPLPIRLVSNSAVTRPVPAQQRTHPRDFEITHIKRRFSPKVKEDDHASILIFKLVPSDPDFPFELDGLRITLTVPHTYPSNGSPTIRIDNPEMERGYQINVERGFDELVANYPTKTLLALMNELDKNLESFLISERARTIKLVANADLAPMQYPQRAPRPAIPHETSNSVPTPMLVQYTSQQREEARLKREANVRQIEARMGRQPLYSQSSDRTTFNIPLQIPQIVRLPTSLQAIKDVRLLVPRLYPLESCSIRLREGSKEAELVEKAFEKHAKEHPELTLMAHINHLVQNMHLRSREVDTVQEPHVSKPKTTQPVIVENEAILTEDPPRIFDTDRPHVQLIPRPPEWDLAPTESDDDDESGYTDSDMSQSDVEEEAGGAQLGQSEQVAAPGPERGILLSFPMLELYSIELLQVSSISLTIKCYRCKDTMDVMGIKPATAEGGISRNVESCKKCSSSLSVAYRAEPMHMNSIRAGFLDLEGCTVADLLPSHFQPTCSECSTTFAKPGVVSVRGETSMAVCRECHKKMTFKLPEVKFLRVSSAERPNRPLPRKKPKENLGIVAGNELPRKGRCQHYAKSYRWFRFSCCQKVYACDRCHDAAEEHPNEHANRMICGLCSREQHYRPEDCGFCHSGLVGKKSGGFWEGGKGTRDKIRMSRKDPRKYKRRGGGAVSAKAK